MTAKSTHTHIFPVQQPPSHLTAVLLSILLVCTSGTNRNIQLSKCAHWVHDLYSYIYILAPCPTSLLSFFRSFIHNSFM